MKKLLLILLLFAALGGSVAPSLGSLLGFFAPAVAHAQDDQGEDNDDQGENEQ
jgi:hypothetical protein